MRRIITILVLLTAIFCFWLVWESRLSSSSEVNESPNIIQKMDELLENQALILDNQRKIVKEIRRVRNRL